MKLKIIAAALLLVSQAGFAANPGDEVIVVYNTRVPESKMVADHYAEVRAVPTNQVWGFDLPVTEEISRAVFTSELQQPLAKKLTAEKLWRTGSEVVTGTNTAEAKVLWKITASKIRYAVLCYGVPAHITEDGSLVEPAASAMRAELKRNEACVDSELALLPLFNENYPRVGPFRNLFYTTTNATVLNPTNGILLVTRLDGPTPEIARGLVDKAVQAERDGLWGRAYFDLRLTQDPNYKLGDEWIFNAAKIAQLAGYEIYADTNEATLTASFPMSQVALYAGWYDGNASGPFTLTNCEFMPGAFAYHLHSYSAASIRTATEHWVGPLLARGATCTMGCVAEPYLQFMPDVGTFMGRFLIYGFTFAESAYAAAPALSWQTTVIGDPLYRPGGKNPQQQHLQLAAQKSPLLEWSHLKVINLNLVKRFPIADCVAYLEENHATQTSAVLSEKLAEIQAALGKPASAIRALQAALTLNPSPMQRLRLRLTLGEKLAEQGRTADALEDYRALLTESPNYLGNETVRGKITALEASAATTK
ncbi:MAG: hypothetical protein RLZZ350_1559 [Verrucomicrobiota bacterium]|jgi:uncharacterized protein (TIGR03790 family)